MHQAPTLFRNYYQCNNILPHLLKKNLPGCYLMCARYSRMSTKHILVDLCVRPVIQINTEQHYAFRNSYIRPLCAQGRLFLHARPHDQKETITTVTYLYPQIRHYDIICVRTWNSEPKCERIYSIVKPQQKYYCCLCLVSKHTSTFEHICESKRV